MTPRAWGLGAATVLVAACSTRAGRPCQPEFLARQATTDARPWTVEVTYAAGGLVVQPADARYLYRLEACLEPDGRALHARWDSAAARLEIALPRSDRPRHGGAISVRRGGERRLRVELNPRRPLDLRLTIGAVGAQLRLGGLSLRRLEIQSNAAGFELRFDRPNPLVAEKIAIAANAAGFKARGLGFAHARTIVVDASLAGAELDFDGDWDGAPPETRVDVRTNLGGVTVRMPRRADLAVELRARAALGGVEAADLRPAGEAYRSANWSSAKRRVVIDARAALGGVVFRWVETDRANGDAPADASRRF